MADPGPRIQRTLLEAYGDVVDALRGSRVPFVLYGAFAMAAYGYERATRDVDLIVPRRPRMFRSVYAEMRRLGAVPAPPGSVTAEHALKQDVRHITFNHEGWLIDFFFDPEFDRIRSRAIRRKFGNRIVAVISRKDLAKRKAKRGTLQDLADIERLKNAK